MQIVTAAISEGQRHHGRLALNVNEAGVVAGVGRDGIYAAIRAKRLEARKLGAARSSFAMTWRSS